jgi:hypothetical protein
MIVKPTTRQTKLSNRAAKQEKRKITSHWPVGQVIEAIHQKTIIA